MIDTIKKIVNVSQYLILFIHLFRVCVHILPVIFIIFGKKSVVAR